MDELGLLIEVLPESLRDAVRGQPLDELLEIVMDLGRAPEARLGNRAVALRQGIVTRADIEHVLERVGPPGEDNRAGIERTLHRISAIRNRKGQIIGLTLRVGRALFGTIEMLRDLVETGLNILLLGRPGIGKTTKLREIARVLADDLGRRVVVVDTSNEIGGDGDVPHAGIGGARRMQVPRPDRQHDLMIEAVENHMPEAIIVDEIGTAAETIAARTIAERGVQLIGTAHGNTLENLILNPTLSDLIGGVHAVTLSDEETRRRHLVSKTVLERRAPPTFDIVVEMVDRDEVVIHRDTADAVDRLLAGKRTGGERRVLREGQVRREPPSTAPTPTPTPLAPAPPPPLPIVERGEQPVRIHAHALSRDLLARVLRDLDVEARIVDRPEAADLIVSLRARADDPRLRRAAAQAIPIYSVKRNSSSELRRVLRDIFAIVGGLDEEQVREAVQETEHAIQRVLAEGVPIALSPRPPELRKMQHRLAARYHLEAGSVDRGGQRHLVVYPRPGGA
jgi:stage III sporulation protein SpoIIIAA